MTEGWLEWQSFVQYTSTRED